jgi:hypothetical protein
MNFIKQLRWAFTRQHTKQQMMDNVISALEADPETRQLLEMVRADHINIRLEPRLSDTGTDGAYTLGFNTISLDPFLPLERQQATLAHELRHYWQYKKLDMTPRKYLASISGNPRLAFIFNRVIEADAFTFATMWQMSKDAAARGEAQPQVVTMVFSDKTEKTASFTYEGIFSMYLDSKAFSNSYDTREALHLYGQLRNGVLKSMGTRLLGVPEVTIGEMRDMLKAGVANDAPAYAGILSDRQFEALVLRHADKHAYQAVRLMKKFNAAVAVNDNKTVEETYIQLRKKVKTLKPKK